MSTTACEENRGLRGVSFASGKRSGGGCARGGSVSFCWEWLGWSCELSSLHHVGLLERQRDRADPAQSQANASAHSSSHSLLLPFPLPPCFSRFAHRRPIPRIAALVQAKAPGAPSKILHDRKRNRTLGRSACRGRSMQTEAERRERTAWYRIWGRTAIVVLWCMEAGRPCLQDSGSVVWAHVEGQCAGRARAGKDDRTRERAEKVARASPRHREELEVFGPGRRSHGWHRLRPS